MSHRQPNILPISCSVWPIVHGAAIAALWSLIPLPAAVLAQSITAATDGTGTIITLEGRTYQIQGGTQTGANLFHSFQALGLSNGEIANFLSHPSISNIFGRVTGGDPSVLNGLIQVTGAESNLYLMNPAGLVFGAGARLNVGGDFVATTADRIAVGEGWFWANGVNDYASLGGAPNQFAFASEQPGAVFNFGTLGNEKNVGLLGGTVVNAGQVVSTAGTVTIAAVPGERLVNISQQGMLLSLEIMPEALATGAIRPVDFPTLLTGAGRGNPSVVAPDPVGVGTGALPRQRFSGDVVINGEVTGQQIDLYAAGQVTPVEPNLVQGKTRVIRFSQTGENPHQALFIDARADHSQNLLYGAVAGTIAQLIERDENGVAAIAEQLAGISESMGALDSVAIVAEGNAGDFWLGNQWLRAQNITDYQQQLQTWGAALTRNADILLYSCFTALGAAGEGLIAGIAEMTGADVAASTNATGSANYDADWTLETNRGTIEAATPFTAATLAIWDGKLMTHTVNTLADAGAGSLRSQIAAAGVGDNIDFSVSGTITLMSTISVATDNLTIDGGNQIVVDGGGAVRLFSVSAANATWQNITLQNGNITSDSGGAIAHNGNGTLTLDNVTLQNNSADFFGGAIFSFGHVNIANSTLTGNAAGSDSGGAVYIANALPSHTVTVDNSTLSGNTAGDDGGAIALANGTITLTNSSIISNNTAASDGGGLSANANITVTDSTIVNNSAAGNGGGVETNGRVSLSSTIISGNSAGLNGGGISSGAGPSYLSATSSLINNSAINGGGLHSTSGDVTLTDATVTGNTAGSDGGGIVVLNGDLTLTNVRVTYNSSGFYGGGIQASETIIIDDSTILGNSTGRDGGGIDGSGALSFISITNSNISGNLAGRNGGGIEGSGSGLLRLTQSTISGNSATGNGGGLHNLGNVTLNHSTLANNTSSDRGGGLFSNGDVTVNNSTVSGNSTSRSGGGIFSNGVVAIMNATQVANNSAGFYYGGGIYSMSNVTLTNSIVSGNSAGFSGGGIATHNDITLTQSTVAGNSANFSGGGLFNDGNLTLYNSTLSGNFTNQDGGGIDTGGIVTLRNTTVAFNTANGDAIGGGNGGGINIRGINTGHILTNSIIANNAVVGGLNADIAGDLSLASILYNNLIRETTGITGPTITPGFNGHIVGQDPLLAPLANNGGSTQTHRLLPGSPALDAGENSQVPSFLNNDQTGQARISGGRVDIGAVEAIAPIARASSPSPLPRENPSRTEFSPTSPLNTLERVNSETVSRDRIAQFLANGQICQAAIALDQYHSQNVAQHLGRSPTKTKPSCLEMQQRLAADTALLYVFAQADQLHLITLTADEDPSHYQVPLARAALLSELKQFQQALTDPVRRLSKSFLPPAQQLYRWIVEPLLPELEASGIHNILFGLDDGLRTLPIAALHDGEQFLLEQYQVTLIPSFALTPTHRPQLADAAVLSVGISAFETFAPLPAVPLELASIENQFPVGMSLRNEQATLANFQMQLQAQPSPIVHLATHGNFQSGQAENSFIQFWDGPLHLEQLEAVDWSGAAVELLVLSACRTALGNTAWEYGFAGLAVQAQAGAAVAGLWLVNDVATLALMDELYRQLSRGAPKGEALRQAQLALLRGTVRLADQQLVGADETIALPQEMPQLSDRTFWHPYYWSGFTLIGNPW